MIDGGRKWKCSNQAICKAMHCTAMQLTPSSRHQQLFLFGCVRNSTVVVSCEGTACVCFCGSIDTLIW